MRRRNQRSRESTSASRCVVTTEIVFTRDAEGSVTTLTGADASFWARYQAGFDDVDVLARVAGPGPGAEVEGAGVTVADVTAYHGLIEFAFAFPSMLRTAWQITTNAHGVVLRVPGLVSVPAYVAALMRRRPMAVEVCGDPHDAVSAGVGPLGRLSAVAFGALLRLQLRSAVAVAYVTESTLQARYRAPRRAVVASYSSIELPLESIPDRDVRPLALPPRLVTVGSMDSRQKGIDTVLWAARHLADRGVNVSITVVGDGRHRTEYERLAADLFAGTATSVHFTGWLHAGPAVFAQLAAADLYISGSRQEGLPRAVIEAMAHGLPVVATDVGGTAELIDAVSLVPPDDSERLADAIDEILSRDELRASLSQDNRRRAACYDGRTLAARRSSFYRAFGDRCREVFDAPR